MIDKIIQVSGFGVRNTINTQCDYMIVGLTESGRVVLSTGDGKWENAGPDIDETEQQEISDKSEEKIKPCGICGKERADEKGRMLSDCPHCGDMIPF